MALADVQTNERLHFVSESGMIEYLKLRNYHNYDPAHALSLTRQLKQGDWLDAVASLGASPGTPTTPDVTGLTAAQHALHSALTLTMGRDVADE